MGHDSSPLGSRVFLCDKEFGPAVPCAALKKLPYRQVIKTKAQEGIWSRAGSVAGTISEGKPEAAQEGTGALGQCGQKASLGPECNHHRQVL